MEEKEIKKKKLTLSISSKKPHSVATVIQWQKAKKVSCYRKKDFKKKEMKENFMDSR